MSLWVQRKSFIPSPLKNVGYCTCNLCSGLCGKSEHQPIRQQPLQDDRLYDGPHCLQTSVGTPRILWFFSFRSFDSSFELLSILLLWQLDGVKSDVDEET